MRPLQSRRWLLLAPVALGLAVLLVAAAGPQRDAVRLTNLNVGDSWIPSLYLQTDPQVPGRCHVTNRRGSTLRRSDDPEARRDWDLLRAPDPGGLGLEHYLVRSRGRGAFLLVPAFAVEDWTYPLFHAFVRAESGRALPAVTWERLFLDRVYRGVYLRVRLPAERPDRGPGEPRREILAIRGASMGCADNLLRSPCETYPELIAAGRFPPPPEPTGLLRWLADLAPGGERSLLLHPQAPHRISWLPLPVSLRREYATLTGEEMEEVRDDRFRTSVPSLMPGAALDRLPPEGRRALIAAWDEYRRRIVAATMVHCLQHACTETLEAAWAERLDAPWQRAGGPA